MTSKQRWIRYGNAGADIYVLLILAWWATHTRLGDTWWWLFVVNALAVYLFVPLPLLLSLAWMTHRRRTWIGGIIMGLLGLHLYGGLFLPRSPSPPPQQPLTIMSYNILRYHQDTDAILAVIRAERPDVVMFQELTPLVADALRHELHIRYPYQLLEPATDSSGMGILSSYPLQPTDIILPGEWTGPPQIATLTLPGHVVTLMNIHARSTSLGNGGPLTFHPETMERSIRAREQQAQTIATFAANHTHPLIVAGDLNATEQHHAYRIISEHLQDAWRVAGWGLGHTFPGAASHGSSRPHILGMPVPKWLVRIDYIFCSDDWRVVRAAIGSWDGISDHRPLVVTLDLVEDNTTAHSSAPALVPATPPPDSESL